MSLELADRLMCMHAYAHMGICMVLFVRAHLDVGRTVAVSIAVDAVFLFGINFGMILMGGIKYGRSA